MGRETADPDGVIVDALIAVFSRVQDAATFTDDELTSYVVAELKQTDEGRALLRAFRNAIWKVQPKIRAVATGVRWRSHGIELSMEPMPISQLDVYRRNRAETSFARAITNAPNDPQNILRKRNRTGHSGEAPQVYRVIRKADRMFKHVRIYFVTDRAARMGADGAKSFSSVRAANDTLSCGQCTVSFPPSHKTGNVESPKLLEKIFTLSFDDDERRHVVVQSVQTMTAVDFYNSLRGDVAEAPERDVLLFVHGYNTSFSDAVKRAAQVKLDSPFVGPTVLFSWPSKRRWQLYSHDLDQIAVSAHHLRDILSLVKHQTRASRIHVVAHSLGARLLTEAISLLPGDVPKPVVRELILAAPDININVFSKLAGALRSAADRVTIYASDHDRALEFSHKYNGNGRVGDARHLGDINHYEGIDVIDASNVRTARLGHGYLTDSALLLRDLHDVIEGIPLPRWGIERGAGRRSRHWCFIPAAR